MNVRVLFPMAALGPLDYAVPSGVDLTPGDHVSAPLGARRLNGVVWPGAPQRHEGLREIVAKLDAPHLRPDLLDFITFVSDYTLSPIGAVLAMALRAPGLHTASSTTTVYVPGECGGDRAITPTRQAVLNAASVAPGGFADLARRAGCTPGVPRTMADLGLLKPVQARREAPFKHPDAEAPGFELEGEQIDAAARLRASVAAERYSATLLDGVTGSGKTEVYFEAVAEALRRFRTAQILILLPEIALTRDVISRVAARFQAAPAEWHSDVSGKERLRTWRAVASGEARIVVGARSALFLPFRDLRLIVVDEEHDGSFKQEEGVTYHARDMAVARAHRANFPVLLSSATPSLESRLNAEAGRYELVRLASRRGAARLPDIRLVDLRQEKPDKGTWLSPTVVEETACALSRGEQALFFLNRRGFAPLLICRACGGPLKAPDSDTLLVYHRFERRAVCHHTGFSMPVPSRCPDCSAENAIAPFGPGVERIFEEAQARFPDARVAIASSDVFQRGQDAKSLLDAMRRGAIDILVGTQVLAKGHNFPNLTLIAVIDADLGLKGGDLRAGERTYQLLSQAAGRAGRADKPGIAILQTLNPDAPVFQALMRGDRDAFYDGEAEARRLLGFPPFGRLAALIVSSDDHAAAERAAKDLGRSAPHGNGVEVWGPAPAPIGLLRGRARWRLLLKADRNTRVQPILRRWLSLAKTPQRVRISVDIDPYSFL